MSLPVLLPHYPEQLTGCGANEGDAAVLAQGGELGGLAQEAVSREDGIAACKGVEGMRSRKNVNDQAECGMYCCSHWRTSWRWRSRILRLAGAVAALRCMPACALTRLLGNLDQPVGVQVLLG